MDQVDLSRLARYGWVSVEGVSSREELVSLGNTLGTLILTPKGELVKEIRVVSKESAEPGSQSALHGTGIFPLHTDTVFWPTPIKYVVLRGSGDARRPTMVMHHSDLLESCDANVRENVPKSVWVSKAGRPFYCSMMFYHEGVRCFRYDFDLMSPANKAAHIVDEALRPLTQSGIGAPIHWSGKSAIVLSNWLVLHGRGPGPRNEGTRLVERLYVG